MRTRHAVSVAPFALAVLWLAGCGGTVPAPVPTTAVPATADAASATAAPTAAGAARCTAADLSVALGTSQVDGASGQVKVPLVFTNTSKTPCVTWGVPGVDLQGPADPNGPVYSLLRPGSDAQHPHITVAPGSSATATVTYLTDTPGSVGSSGSTGWMPTQLVTTPPGDTHQITVPWTGHSVLRQDAATHPGSFVGPLAAS